MVSRKLATVELWTHMANDISSFSSTCGDNETSWYFKFAMLINISCGTYFMASIIVRESCLRLKCMSNSVWFPFFPVFGFYVLKYEFIPYTNFTHIAAGNTIVVDVAKQVTPTFRHQSCRILLFLVFVHFDVMEELTVNDRFTPRLSKLDVAYVVGPPVVWKNYVFRFKSRLVHCRRRRVVQYWWNNGKDLDFSCVACIVMWKYDAVIACLFMFCSRPR